jgi:hypothetical protein
MSLSKYESRAGWILVDTKRLLQLNVGDAAKTSKGEHVVIESLHPPQKVSSQGKVTVRFTEPGNRKILKMTYFASVIDAEWQYKGLDSEPVERENITETCHRLRVPPPSKL